MKNILFANLGNRNISFQGKTFDGKNEKPFGCSSFREFTKVILDNYDQYEQYITLNIIPSILEHLEFKVDLIVLFYSDTPEGERNDQDTIYEAEIFKKKLFQLYPTIQTELRAFKCKVVDSEALMKRYQNYFRSFKKEYPKGDFHICDAGGTPQQKMAMKIIAEFMFEEEQLHVYGVELSGNEISSVINLKAVEYRNVIAQMQIISLLYAGDYVGALLIIENNSVSSSSFLKNTLKYCDYLMSNNVDQAIRFGKNNFRKKDLENNPSIIPLLGNELILNNYPVFEELMSEDDFLRSSLILSIAQWNRFKNSYGLAILFYSIFVEQYISAVIAKQSTPYELEGSVEKFNRFLVAMDEKKIFPEYIFPEYIDKQKMNYANLPFKISLASSIPIVLNNKLMSLISNSNSYLLRVKSENTIGLDTLRNKFAHEGKFIPSEDFNKFSLIYDGFEKTMMLPDNNIFNQLNENLIQIITS